MEMFDILNKLEILKREINEEKAKKDYDKDGKIESPEKEHAGAVDNAIKKSKTNEDIESVLRKLYAIQEQTVEEDDVEEGNEFANKVNQLKAQGAKPGTKFKTSDGQEHVLESDEQGVAEGGVKQLPTQGADYSKYDTDTLKMMLRPGILHRNEAGFKALIRKELQKREQQSQQGVAEGSLEECDMSPLSMPGAMQQEQSPDRYTLNIQRGDKSLNVTTDSPDELLNIMKLAGINSSAGGYIRNASAGSGAHTYLGLINNNGTFGGMFLNSSARSADGGANNMTIRNDGGDLILSAKSSTPQIYLQESTDRIYIKGIINILESGGGGAYVVPNNHMREGSLTIGSINLDYGLGSGLNTNCAGLILECSNNTEIAVHDYAHRLTSLIAYQGGTSYNNITIGRDMGAGWGSAWNVNIAGASLSLANEWYLVKATSPTGVINSLVFLHSTGTITSRWWLNGTQNGTSSEISDERIKKEIKDIDNPIEKLLLIKPKEYYLCSDKDYNKKYGIIAQDIIKEESLKHLIYTDKEYIANLLTNAKFIKEKIGEEEVVLEYPEEKYIKTEENPTPYQRPKPKEIFKYTITTEKNLNGLINIDDELKIVLDNNDIENIEIIIDDTPYNNRYKKRFVKVKEIIDDYSFEIYEDIETSQIEKDNLFIYGKKVDDFLKLDYESLYCLNIKATQELIQKNQQLEKRIEKLEELFRTRE